MGSPSHHASQNLSPVGAHRIIGVERYLWRPPVQIPVQSRANFKVRAGCSSARVFSISKDADSRLPPGHHLTSDPPSWFFLYMELEFPSLQLVSAAYCPWCTPLGRVQLHCLYTHPHYLPNQIPLKLLSSRLNKASALSISLNVTCSNSLIIFIALY